MACIRPLRWGIDVSPAQDPASDESPSQGRGEFFMVDRRTWLHVCGMGINEAVSFLVLARGSGPDNASTRWSVDAIERYTGMSRKRAKPAIASLAGAKVIVVQQDGTRPRYRINSPKDIPGIKTGKADEAEWLWLPNAIVSGAADEVPPVELLRQTQDIMLLRLFCELYGAQDLVAEGGIDRAQMYKKAERLEVGQHAEFTVWGFGPLNEWVRETPVSSPHCDPPKKSGEPGRAKSWFERTAQLRDLGLIEWLPFLVESSDLSAELIHPCSMEGNGSIEAQIGYAAHQASFRMLPDGKFTWARDQLGPYAQFAPVKRHLRKVELIGVARLRYRPRTSRTSAWWAELQHSGPQWAKLYEALASDSTATITASQNRSA
jgi:hypothetical protein